MGYVITRPGVTQPGTDIPIENPDWIPDSQSTARDIEEDYSTGMFDNSNWNSNDYNDLDVDISAEEAIVNGILGGTGADVSLSQYMSDHPGATPEEYFQYMSEHSDEWAEKYLDYMLEKQSLDEQNKYTANREDTAYQRLVADLKAAGLNPAMMYGSSASPSASNSLGYLKQNEGATSRSISSFTKLKNLILGFLSYELYRKLDTVDSIFGNAKKFTGMLKDLGPLFM